MRTQKSYGRLRAALVLIGASALLAGCGNGGLSQTFGFSRASPDEFAVTTQAPLSMPPDLALRPPRPGEPRPQDVSESRQAEEALTPQATLGTAQAGLSAGQEAFLQQAGPPAPTGIRKEIGRENDQQEAANDSLVDKLLFWRQPTPSDIVINPKKESERLREDAALGRSPETGETPIIQPGRKNWLDSLF